MSQYSWEFQKYHQGLNLPFNFSLYSVVNSYIDAKLLCLYEIWVLKEFETMVHDFSWAMLRLWVNVYTRKMMRLLRLFAEIVHHIVYLKWAFVVLEDCINTTVFVVEPTVWCSPAHRRCRWKRTTTVRLFFPQFFFNFLVRLFTLLDIDQLANAVDLVRDEKEWKVFLHEDNKSFKSIFKDLASWHFQKEDVKK